MQVDLLATSARDLARLRAHAEELRSFELPGLIGRFTHRGRVRALLADTAETARAAERSLRAAGYGPAADSIASALTRIESTPVSGTPISLAGHGALDAIATARHHARDDLVQLERDLLSREPTDADASTLAALLYLDGTAGTTLAAARPTRDTIELAGRVAGPDDIVTARSVHAELRRRAPGDQEVVDDVHALVSQDPSHLSATDWQRLATHLRSDPHGSLLSGPRQLDSLRRFEDLAAAGPPGPELHEALRSYFGQWRLATMPEVGRVELVRGVLATPARDVSLEQWQQLQYLMQHPPSLPVLDDVLRDIGGARAAITRAGGGLGLSAARRLHANWTVHRLAPPQRIDLAREIVAIPPERVVEGQWAQLEALLHTDVPGPRQLPDVNDFGSIARAQAHDVLREPSGYWNAAPYFSAWNEALDPRYAARLATAIDDIAAGRGSDESLGLLLVARERLASLMADRPPEQQRAIATAVLGGTAVGSGPGTTQVLRTLREGLSGPSAHVDLDHLRAETLELVERNLARLEGRPLEGAARGFGRHPDYAEVGRIRANLDLMDAIARRHRDELLSW